MLQRVLGSEGLQRELREALREIVAFQRGDRADQLLITQGLEGALQDARVALEDARRAQAEAASAALHLSSRLDDVEAMCAGLERERDALKASVAALEARLAALEPPPSVEASQPPVDPPRSSGMGFRLITEPPGALPHLATDMVVVERRHTPFGSTRDEPGRSGDEVSQQTAALPWRFAIQRAPVTNALWDEIMNVRGAGGEPEHPKTSITFAEARRFCNLLSRRDGLVVVYMIDMSGNVRPRWDSNGYRLPLEVEWEAAARAGLTDMCYGAAVGTIWSEESAGHNTQPVMRLKPNSLGLYDMLGNVREMCLPTVLGDLPARVYPNELVPVRGGSTRFPASECRFATRQRTQHTYKTDDIGFRVVRTLGEHPT